MRDWDPNRRRIRFGIATDEPVTCSGIQSVFHDQPEIRLVWLPVTPADLSSALRLLQIDVLLLDSSCGCDLTLERQLRTEGFISPIILWSRDAKAAYDPDSGPTFFIDKRSAPMMLLACVESVLSGRGWNHSPAIPFPGINDAVREPVHVSPREVELINLVAEGLSNREIANQMNLTEGSVKVYFSRLFHKLGVSDRVGLLLHLMQSPLVDELLHAKGSRQPRKHRY